MKIHPLVLALLTASSLYGSAQGVVHLGPGESYLFTQPTFLQGHVDESGRTIIQLNLGFTGDLFTAGDSLSVSLFSTPGSPTALLTNLVTSPPWSNPFGVGNTWLETPWYAPGGTVQVTMISGSVDLSSVTAITTQRYAQAYWSYTIPEPSNSLLLFVSVVLGGICRLYRKRLD